MTEPLGLNSRVFRSTRSDNLLIFETLDAPKPLTLEMVHKFTETTSLGSLGVQPNPGSLGVQPERLVGFQPVADKVKESISRDLEDPEKFNKIMKIMTELAVDSGQPAPDPVVIRALLESVGT